MITGIDTSAPVVARHSITIDAPLRRVWDLHTDVSGWTSWQSDITAASADGPLVPGSVFHWTTFGMEIASTVYAVEEPYRILWGGPAHGIDGIHQWTFTEADGIVQVHTEESWDGDPIRADAESMAAALDASLTAWLERLKKTAENA
ncbi:SRPBCC family protein [Nonomuraea rhodomycinica]|uniref:SRPBCC family protein n=1 Tax=Nonomuraea rhodomycinica TaxID=1712872 RepID=A0A7Y6M9F7_9ACTN|nr:SRPBCC family protein [Nonomuraea rhodomycinica]NUW39587.1 SRPBCC family protein [Nonomuraea rhodomycinica]